MKAAEPSAVPVTLEAMLLRKEERVRQQQQALFRHDKPVVSLTIVFPGPVKDTGASRYLFGLAMANLSAVCDRHEWAVVERRKMIRRTGPEAIVSVDAPGDELKRQLIALEEDHPLGRLWDFDVILPGRTSSYSRSEFGLPARRCLICEEAAFACGRSRRHSSEELLAAIEDRIHAFRCS